MPSPALAVARVGQKAVRRQGHGRVGVARPMCLKGADLVEGGGQANEVEGQPTQERAWVGRRGRCDPLGLQALEDEAVEFVATPFVMGDARRLRGSERLEGPVLVGVRRRRDGRAHAETRRSKEQGKPRNDGKATHDGKRCDILSPSGLRVQGAVPAPTPVAVMQGGVLELRRVAKERRWQENPSSRSPRRLRPTGGCGTGRAPPRSRSLPTRILRTYGPSRIGRHGFQTGGTNAWRRIPCVQASCKKSAGSCDASCERVMAKKVMTRPRKGACTSKSAAIHCIAMFVGPVRLGGCPPWPSGWPSWASWGLR